MGVDVGMDASCSDWLLEVLAFLAVTLPSGLVLITSQGYGGFAGFACILLVFVIVSLRYRAGISSRVILVATGVVMAFALTRVAGWQALVVVSMGFGLVELSRLIHLAKGGGCVEPTWLPLEWSSLALAGLLWLRLETGWGWRAIDRLMSLTTLRGAPVGFHASAFPIYLLGLFTLIARSLLGHDPRHMLKGLMLAGWAIAGRHLLLMFCAITPLRLSLFQIGSVGLVAWVTMWRIRQVRSWIRPCLGITAVTLLGSLLALVSVGPAMTPKVAAIEPEPRAIQTPSPDVILYAIGFLNWETPSPERLGLVNSGMFGLLRRSLDRLAQARLGRLVMADSITSKMLETASLAIFINPTRCLSGSEVEALRSFVTAGGGMLVLGDHTDIAGSRGALNSVLAFTNIRFNFDSAVALRKFWRGCLEIRTHPVTRGIDDEVSLQIATGASLAIASPAEPIVLGKYGFADRGDSSNGGFKAFLGNLTHEPCERLGDVVLVAAQRLGRGRVLVFGDTSPFQNGSLPITWRLVENSIGWLMGIDVNRESGDQLQLGYGTSIAIIDFTLRSAASLEPFNSNSLSGLANCLARLDIEPRIARSTREWLPAARYMFVVSPRRSLEPHIGYLMNYMRLGGNLILAQGCEAPLAAQSLLDSVGLAIESTELGRGQPGSPHHRRAFPIRVTCQGDTLTLASVFGYPTIVVKQVGQGWLTLIGDPGFLLDENLESERTAIPQNVDFIRRLVNARGGDVVAKP